MQQPKSTRSIDERKLCPFKTQALVIFNAMQMERVQFDLSLGLATKALRLFACIFLPSCLREDHLQLGNECM